MPVTTKLFSEEFEEQTGKAPEEVDRTFSNFTKRARKTGARIVFCGDSITHNSYQTDKWNDMGWVTWFRRYYGEAVDVKGSDILAVSGMGTDHLVSTQLPQVLAGEYDICITMIGTNDLSADVDRLGNLATFYDTLEEAGIFAVALPVLPHSDAETLTETKERNAEAIFAYLSDRAFRNSSMMFVNTLPKVTDFATGDAIPGLLRDGVHTTKVGAKILGDIVASELESIIKPQRLPMYGRGNLYDPATNSRGQLVKNPMMRGDSGVPYNGATGDVADEYLANRPSNGLPWDFAFEKVSNPYGFGEAQKITLSGTGDGAIGQFRTVEDTVYSSVPDGTLLRVSFDVDVAGLTGIDAFYLAVIMNGVQYYDGNTTAGDPGAPPSDFSGTLSVDVPYVAGEIIKPRLTWLTSSGVVIAGEITVKAVSIRPILMQQ